MSRLDQLNTELKELDESIDELHDTIEKTNSLRYNFFRGMVSGTGTAIGASIIAAILIGLLVWSVRAAEGVPFFKKLIDASGINTLLQKPD